MMKKSLFFIIGLMISLNLKAQYTSLKESEIQKLKILISKNNSVKNIIKGFREHADQALNEEPHPIEVIRSEGLLVGNPLKTASLTAVKDVKKIYALSLVYKLLDSKIYLDKSTKFLIAWANTNQATGNQIDETKLEDAIVGYDLIRNDIEPSKRELIDHWLKNIADAEINSIYAKPGRGTAKNNWNSHRIKIITLIAYTLHTSEYDEFINKELNSQIAFNLLPDGSSLDFKDRDALHYHIYDLEPLLQTAISLKRAKGVDYFNNQSETGSSIKKSIDFLVPFVTGEQKHIEFANSKSSFDKARANNNEKGYQLVNFIPSTGINVLSMATYFDKNYLNAIDKANQNKQKLDWQLILSKIKD